MGNPGAARDQHEQALTISREIGERTFEVEAINGLGVILLAVGDADTSRARYASALTLADQTGDRHEQAAAHDVWPTRTTPRGTPTGPATTGNSL